MKDSGVRFRRIARYRSVHPLSGVSEPHCVIRRRHLAQADALFPWTHLARCVADAKDRYLVLIDGECTMCRATGAWVNLRDKKRRFRFEALQSEQGKKLLEEHGLPTDDYDTMVLIEDDEAYIRSTAGLRIARRLRAPWPLLYGFIIVPRPLRDAVYRFVAKNRHKIKRRKARQDPAE